MRQLRAGAEPGGASAGRAPEPGGHQSRAARDVVPGIQAQSHAPEEALRQMTVYSEGKTVSAAAAAPCLES